MGLGQVARCSACCRCIHACLGARRPAGGAAGGHARLSSRCLCACSCVCVCAIMCVCVCVRVRVCACVRACVCARESWSTCVCVSLFLSLSVCLLGDSLSLALVHSYSRARSHFLHRSLHVTLFPSLSISEESGGGESVIILSVCCIVVCVNAFVRVWYSGECVCLCQ